MLDFYCAKARLAIEIDGVSHDMGGRPKRDIARDTWLQSRGIRVVRIAASEVIRQMDDVADAIIRMPADRLL